MGTPVIHCRYDELVPVRELKPHPKNRNTHPDDQIDRLAKILSYQGIRAPIVVSNLSGFIVKGHGTLAAFKRAGGKQAPVVRQDFENEEQEYAFVQGDNAIAAWAELDLSGINSDLGDLGPDFDIEMLGLKDFELVIGDTLEPQCDEDEVPEHVEPKTRLGDIYQLGRHRLMCGDSTSIDAVERLLMGKRANVCLTDPPYGLGDTESEKNNYSQYEDTRENLISTVEGFFPLAQQFCDVIVLTPGNANTRLYPEPRWTMAWFTPAGAGSGPWGFCCWQPILCYGTDPKLSKGLGRHPDAIVHTESAEKLGHPCAKPINFWGWLMERVSEPGELIYEPFSGSGTTHIAAEKLNRSCYGMELDPKYCDIIVARWEKYTGKQAKLLTPQEEDANGAAS